MLNTWKPRLICAALVGMLAVIGCFDFETALNDCKNNERCIPDPCVSSDDNDQPDDDFRDTNCDGVDGIATAGIYVDPVDGADNNSGTMNSPVRTIKKALELLRGDAGAGITALYLARGRYDEEQLTLDRPVSLYGAYGGAANRWKRKSEYSTHLDGGTIGLTVSGLGQDAGVRLEWLTITSSNATAPGTPSIALRVLGSDLQLRHAIVAAGLGAPGTQGANGDAGTDGPDGGPGLSASAATTGLGGGAPMHLCGDSNQSGGSGRTGAKFNPGGAGQPGVPTSDGGGPGGDGGVLGERVAQGSNAFYCEAGHGQDGAPGAPGAAGDTGPGGGSGMGEVRGGTWVSTPQGLGGAGTPGEAGAGGGGGGSGGGCPEGDLPGPVTNESAGGGGSGAGGAGGCGGHEGLGGGPGGASIALLLIDSSVQLGSVTLSTQGGGAGGAGGNGGNGGRGGEGGPGGDGGAILAGASWQSKNYQSFGGKGGAGGQGGAGGNGGPGGGGAGGPSVGVWCSDGGVSAMDSAITQTLRDAGTGGASSGNRGADGQMIPYHMCNPTLP
jgi:hypothetical protein